jgi:hypothetical protein
MPVAHLISPLQRFVFICATQEGGSKTAQTLIFIEVKKRTDLNSKK